MSITMRHTVGFLGPSGELSFTVEDWQGVLGLDAHWE